MKQTNLSAEELLIKRLSGQLRLISDYVLRHVNGERSMDDALMRSVAIASRDVAEVTADEIKTEHELLVCIENFARMGLNYEINTGIPGTMVEALKEYLEKYHVLVYGNTDGLAWKRKENRILDVPPNLERQA